MILRPDNTNYTTTTNSNIVTHRHTDTITQIDRQTDSSLS